ncbi:MAG TPA: hypothetical protein VFJ74_17160 [Gemmatimonadaceae bacterium]|nr:hypothetical protein [Gemmatimonadaceae bacterium]
MVRLLERDVAGTVGEAHRQVVASVADDVRELDIPDRAEKIVSDVQQYLQDTRVDPVWPPCPRHGRHPLWYRSGEWWCVEDGVAVAKLGELTGQPEGRAG